MSADQKQDMRAAIMKAAEELFATQGFHNTTIAQIAKRAGCATGTPYLYFESKEDLYFAILDEKSEVLLEEIRAIADSGATSLDKLREVIKNCLEYFENDKDFLRLSLPERSGVSWDLDDERVELILSKYERARELVASIVDECRDKFGVCCEDSFTLASLLVGMINEMAFLRLLGKRESPLGEACEVIFRVFTQGIVEGDE